MAEVEDKRTTPVLTEENLQTALEVEFNDALRLGNLDSAAKLLADYKAQNGETAVYFYRQALLNERSGKLKEAYDALKKLYFENPVFMLGRNDFVRVSMLNIREPLSDIKEEIKRYQAEYYKQLDQKREDAVKMVLVDKKSQMEVERTILGKKNCTGTINRWIREYIQEGEENCFKKKKGLNKVEITEENVRYEILKKFNAFLEKEIRTNSNSFKTSKSNNVMV